MVMASSAVVSGCGDDSDPGIEHDPGFVSLSCEDPEGDLVRGLTPEPPVDYLELRKTTLSEGDVGASRGELCGTAEDEPQCLALVTQARRTSNGFLLSSCIDNCEQYYFIATQGDDVARFSSAERVAALLGSVDTPEEAMLLVRMQGFATPCAEAGAKPEGDGFKVQAITYEGCDGKTRHLFRVSADGVVTKQDSTVLKKADPNCAVGRRPAGLPRPSRRCEPVPAARYLADAARLEAASVHAFRHVTAELRAHGAPRRLIAAARRAAADEVRHARVTAALARRFGARSLEAPRIPAPPPRDLESMVRDNAVEGCVRETFGAAVGVWQAKRAKDAKVAKFMRRIAADELRHAALAWDIAAWAEGKLSANARERIGEAKRQAVAELRVELAQPPHPSIVEALGVPSAGSALLLHTALERRVWR